MRVPSFVPLSALVIPLLLAATVSGGPAAATTEKVLFSFSGHKDGALPNGGLIADAAGALYGVAETGGTAQLGVVYRLTPPAAGQTKWTQSVLHSFEGLPESDGAQPTTGLLMDKSGALYGTTFSGGDANKGTVYQLTAPPGGGTGPWRETVLYSFCPTHGCFDGNQPVGLTLGRNGELYGTTQFGGKARGGTIFMLTPPLPGQVAWTQTVLANLPFGSAPETGLILDATGALFGTTSRGGAFNWGTVFKLAPPAPGKDDWALTTLWSFGATITDGRLPLAVLTRDAGGKLYGTTTLGGGGPNDGVVFRLTPPAPGQKNWHETILHRFTGPDGGQSFSGVTFDRSGAIYGTAADGGAFKEGTMFKLTPAHGNAEWPAKLLHAFGSGKDAVEPIDPLLLRPSGAFVGIADTGGQFGLGAIFEVVP